MAVPSDPSVTTIVTEALKRAGIYNPSSTQITDAGTYQFQEVKSDIRRLASRHPLLRTTAVTATVAGQSRYTQPSDVDVVETVVLLDRPDTWVGTAQTAAASSMTLAASFSEAATTIQGKFLVQTGGTGSVQMGQVITYNDTTKVCTMDAAWGTTPSGTITYLIASDHVRLFEESKPFDWDYRRSPWGLGRASAGAMYGQTLYTDMAADKVYGLLWSYYSDLDRLDETGALFVKLLREWNSVWIQGVAAYVCQRYDEDRFASTMELYQGMLLGLSTEACSVGQARFYDV